MAKDFSLKPLEDRIVVKPSEGEETTSSGLVIPDTAKEKPQQGKVLAVGNGRVNDDGKRVPLDVRSGNLILFGKYAGQEIKLDGEEYLIMKEDDVLAVIESHSTKSQSSSRTKPKRKSVRR